MVDVPSNRADSEEAPKLPRIITERLDALIGLPVGSTLKDMLHATDQDPHTALQGLDFRGHNFRGQDLRGVSLAHCQLEDADLSDALVDDDTDLDKAHLLRTRLPTERDLRKVGLSELTTRLGPGFDEWIADRLTLLTSPEEREQQLSRMSALLQRFQRGYMDSDTLRQEEALLSIELRRGLAIADQGRWRIADQAFATASRMIDALEARFRSAGCREVEGSTVLAQHGYLGPGEVVIFPSFARLRRRRVELAINRWNAVRLLNGIERSRGIIDEALATLEAGVDVVPLDRNEFRASLLEASAAQDATLGDFARAHEKAIEALRIREAAVKEIITSQTLDRLARSFEAAFTYGRRVEGGPPSREHLEYYLGDAMKIYRHAFDRFEDSEARRGLARCMRRAVEFGLVYSTEEFPRILEEAIGLLRDLVAQGLGAARGDLADTELTLSRILAVEGETEAARAAAERAVASYRALEGHDANDGELRAAQAELMIARLDRLGGRPQDAVAAAERTLRHIQTGAGTIDKMFERRDWETLMIACEARLVAARALVDGDGDADAEALASTVVEVIERFDEVDPPAGHRHRRIGAEWLARALFVKAGVLERRRDGVAGLKLQEEALALFSHFVEIEDERSITTALELYRSYLETNRRLHLFPAPDITRAYDPHFGSIVRGEVDGENSEEDRPPDPPRRAGPA